MRRPRASLAAAVASALLLLTCGCAGTPAAAPSAGSDTPSETPATEEGTEDAESKDDEATMDEDDEDANKQSEGTHERAQVSIGRFEEISTVTIDGKDYLFSMPLSQFTADGWELEDTTPLEANDLDGMWLTVESRAAYNAQKDSYFTLHLLNRTEQEMPLDQAELIGIDAKVGSQGAGTEISIVGGLTLGSTMSEFVDELGEPYSDGVAQAENEDSSSETADVMWIFADPENNAVQIDATFNRETLEAEILGVSLT